MTVFTQPDTPHWGGNRDIGRDRWGRPLVTPPGGGEPVGYTRCTTFIDKLSDKNNLIAWKARMTAIGVATHDDLALQVAACNPEDTKALNKLAGQAADAAGASRAATIGTQLHEATERHDLGQPTPPLGKYQAHLDAYTTATAGITWHAVEQFRVHDDLQIGGTADRVALIGNELFIADIKTGGLYDIGKMAMQLAVYARSTPYNPATGQREPDPHRVNQERGLLIHLSEKTGTCELHWLNLTLGWEGVLLAQRVDRWRRFHTNKATRGGMIQPYTNEPPAFTW